MIPRWAHHLRAVAGGYFWISCEDCGKGFGGHQWEPGRGQERATGEWSAAAAYCPECAATRKV